MAVLVSAAAQLYAALLLHLANWVKENMGNGLHKFIYKNFPQFGPTLLRKFHIQVDLSGASFEKKEFPIGSDFSSVALRKANFAKSTFYDVIFCHADLRESKFKHARTFGSKFCGADLREADLSFAELVTADFSGANLREAHLMGATLISAAFRGADLRKANLRSADLRSADLSGADLTEADLSGALLSNANLSECLLVNAWLSGARLFDAKLDGANLSGADLWETQRAGWSIKSVICESVDWDQTGSGNIAYRPGEFERLFSEKTIVRLFYQDGMNPLEIASLPVLIQNLEELHQGSELRLVKIHQDGGGVVVELAIENTGGKEPEQLKTEIEVTAKQAIELQKQLLAEKGQRVQLEGRLEELRLWHREHLLLLASKNQFHIQGDMKMGNDTYQNQGQVGAMGANAHAHDMTFNQIVSRIEQTIDLAALATQLAELRQAIVAKQDLSPQAAIALGKVAEAEVAAQEKNPSKVVAALKAAGQWTLDLAKEAGKDIVVEVFKQSAGMQ